MTAAQQVALVTGASSGIGKATAIALATAGFQVIGTGRNTARSTAPAGVTYLDLDVTNDESVATVVKQVIDQFGHIDVLVNNAGVGATGAAEEFSIAQTQDIFDINVYGVMRMTKAVLPHMRAQRRGRIINVSSSAGSCPARSWRSTSRPSTRSRATRGRWTTRSATTASGSCSSSPARSTPRSEPTACRRTPRCRSTNRDGATTRRCWRKTRATATTPPSWPR